MQQVFHSCHGYLYSILRSYSGNSIFLLPISHLHSFSKIKDPSLKSHFISNEVEMRNSSKPTNQTAQVSSEIDEPFNWNEPTKGNESTAHISHPWPEWVDFMELLLKRGYVESNENPFRDAELGTKETNYIRTACLNFARERSGLIRFFSRKDIHVIAGCGCPSIDRKVVNSGKRLRAYVGIDEGNVCSFCSLRGDCERAYVKPREDEVGRTVDVMRILFTYGLDSVSDTLKNRLCHDKMVKESVRRLLKQIVEYSSKEIDFDIQNGTPLKTGAPAQDHSSLQEKGQIRIPMKQGDWLCPKCNFLNFARNIRCLRCDGLFEGRLQQLRGNQDHLPLKKGDWICEKCNFLNFAKNTRCLQCEEKPSGRQVNPGEWECESCSYINFRRNMICLKCDYRRPKASNASKSCSQPEYPNNLKMKFLNGENEANDCKYVASNRTNNSRVAGMWRFVEEEREDSHSFSSNEESKFLDFPIAGGKSSLSQNAEKRERWKLEMLERSKGAARTTASHDEFEYANSQRRLKYFESTDDEDINEWFGHESKTETKCS